MRRTYQALIAVGELEEAAELLADLEDWSRSVNAPAVGAAAWRCRGLLRAAGGDHDGALEALAESLRAFERLPVPFERGRTLLALGALQRRVKQRGRRRRRWVRRWPGSSSWARGCGPSRPACSWPSSAAGAPRAQG